MPSDLALLSTLIGSDYPCLELIFMVHGPKGVRAIEIPLYVEVSSSYFLYKASCLYIYIEPPDKNIRYNSKIRYNVSLVCTKISGPCISLIFTFYSSGKLTFYVFVRIASRRRF